MARIGESVGKISCTRLNPVHEWDLVLEHIILTSFLCERQIDANVAVTFKVNHPRTNPMFGHICSYSVFALHNHNGTKQL